MGLEESIKYLIAAANSLDDKDQKELANKVDNILQEIKEDNGN